MKRNKPKLALYDECTGCGACAASCNHNAINFDYDRNGFLRPVINEAYCVECGMCMKSCPVLHKDQIPFHNPIDLRCFTAWTTNDELCMRCSSGGVATQIALDFIKGPRSVYYGASIAPNNTCRHVSVTNESEIYPTIGTKYIQSDISWALSDAKNKLRKGWRVLFSGTPCQIAAVYNFIPNSNWDNLFTIELICRGVPSRKVAQNTLDYYACNSILEYRTKKEGWCVNGEKRASVLKMKKFDGDIMYSPRANFFVKTYGIYINPSCFKCQYAKPERVADVILGDQWGLASKYPNRAMKGASSVIVSTKKGMFLLEECDQMYYEENSMSTINAPTFFFPNKSLVNKSLSKRVYLFDELPGRYKMDAFQLNWKKCLWLLPLLLYRKIFERNNGEVVRKAIDLARKKYGWI